MDAGRSQNGIQHLLTAEHEAQRRVSASKSAKQAKDAAEKEVSDFRTQMEAEFQRKLAETSGDSWANVKRLEHETDGKIQNLKSESGRIGRDVVQMLLGHETTIKL